MSAHLYALDPHDKPLRRRVAGRWGRVQTLIYTDRPRCMNHPNPKRPTWACKRPPAVLVTWPKVQTEDGGVPAMAVCEPCLSELRRVLA